MRAPAPVRRVRRRIGELLSSVTDGEGTEADPADGWRLTRSGRETTRWRRDAELLDCFRVGDGYVVTTGYSGIENRWQVTPGHVPLASALAVASLYLEHRMTPHVDRDGRPFIGVRDGTPRQVFDPGETDGTGVNYVYLDAVRSLDEFPPFLDVRTDVKRAYSRMTAPRPRNPGD